MVSKFGIYSQAVTSVWVRLPQVTMLRTCPDMTLAVERDVKPQCSSKLSGSKVISSCIIKYKQSIVYIWP